MKERVEITPSIENEVKIAKRVEQTGMTRDEVIAKALDNFLSSQGF